MTEYQNKINLACGDVFIAGNGWLNLDYRPINNAVQHADLLSTLPLPDNSADLIYSSHFFEHIPSNQVNDFLTECWRVLKPGGVIRLVLPDLENLCRTYLKHRDKGEHIKADFIILEMVDQCVRLKSGGQLGNVYDDLRSLPEKNIEMINFIRERTGDDLMTSVRSTCDSNSIRDLSGLWRRLISRFETIWIKIVLSFLPSAFRKQNISFTTIGEKHHWLWDFEQMRTVLRATGFSSITNCDASVSHFDGFPYQELDLDSDGLPRKGEESMYIEAIKTNQ